MRKNNYFILSGAMGGGKSTILKQLREKGYLCIDEPARQILEEQRSIEGEGVPEKNPELFVQLMLSRSINQYKINSKYNDVVFFDRGIPDLIAHADLSNTSRKVYINASKVYLYNKNVFMFKGWKEIYTTDDERKMDFDSAKKFGVSVSDIYKELGYNIIDVPFISVEKRVEYIIDLIV
ncbi:MAG: AAA family ATPase [Bacteroidota bacterium]|nr:AAA family ATPase [Bacteroidota bacterium]